MIVPIRVVPIPHLEFVRGRKFELSNLKSHHLAGDHQHLLFGLWPCGNIRDPFRRIARATDEFCFGAVRYSWSVTFHRHADDVEDRLYSRQWRFE